MAPSRHADEGGQLPLMDGDRIEEEEEEDCFDSVYKLISQGINAGDVKKLQDAGIYTCNGLMKHTKKSLTGIKGLSEAKVEKIFEAAEKLLSQGFMIGSDLLIPSFEELKGTPEAEVEKICKAAKKLLASSSQADEGVEDESFDSIDMLISEGINSGDVKVLQDAGIYTCNDLMKKTKEDLTRIKGLSEAKIDKIIEAADKLQSQVFETGCNLLINSTIGSQAMNWDHFTDLSKQAMSPADASLCPRVVDPYQCPTPTGSPTWESLLKATEKGKGLAALAWSTLKKNRKALEEKAPAAAEAAGWLADKALPYPVTPMLRAGANVLVKVGQVPLKKKRLARR